jgi:hypothetical protein
VTAWPAIVAVAVLAPAPFAATVNATVPFPFPDAPLVTVSHDGSLLDAVQLHAAPVATEIVAVPPVESTV